jgi:ribonuclease P protein component
LGSGRLVAPPQKGAEAADGVHRFQARPRLTGVERLSRSRRLVRAADLRRVLTSGRSSRETHLDIFWTDNVAGHPRLGVIVPRFRHTAVERNQLRRRLKEIWRREIQAAIPAWDVVLRARSATYQRSFDELRVDLHAWRGARTG